MTIPTSTARRARWATRASGPRINSTRAAASRALALELRKDAEWLGEDGKAFVVAQFLVERLDIDAQPLLAHLGRESVGTHPQPNLAPTLHTHRRDNSHQQRLPLPRVLRHLRAVVGARSARRASPTQGRSAVGPAARRLRRGWRVVAARSRARAALGEGIGGGWVEGIGRGLAEV